MSEILKNDKGFKIIKGAAIDFTTIGCGYGGGIDEMDISEGFFEGFHQVTVIPGGKLCCDNCMHDFDMKEEVYFVAVLNRILCKKCFDEWYEFAVWYNSDKRIEDRNFKNIEYALKTKGLLN